MGVELNPCAEEVWKFFLMGNAVEETRVELHIIEHKFGEDCRVQRLVLFGLFLCQLPGLASLVPSPLCLSCPWQPSPVRGVAQEQVAGGKAQDEEDLLQNHLPAQVTHQVPLGI